MFGSDVLDVAIGLVFIYLVLSLICSAACELIESLLKGRARLLERGLRELFNDADGTGLVREIYSHPLVNSLVLGQYKPGSTNNLPSYIPSRTFALALMDIVGLGGSQRIPGSPAASPVAYSLSPVSTGPGFGSGWSPEAVDNAIIISLTSNPHVSRALLTLAADAGHDLSLLRQSIETWYNSSMDRVSGWFKSRSHFTILTIGFLLCFAINADTLTIARSLATNKSVREALVSAATDSYKRADAAAAAAAASTSAGSDFSPPLAAADPLTSSIPACRADQTSAECRLQSRVKQIESFGLPLGWMGPASSGSGQQAPATPVSWLVKVLGIILTTLAVSLGSPFWFDTLNRVMAIRSAVKPGETVSEPKSPAASPIPSPASHQSEFR